jgi:endo-1,4-beta-xylanase
MFNYKYLKMKKSNFLILMMLSWLAACTNVPNSASDTLAEAFEGKFHVGTALNISQYTEQNPTAVALIHQHFNSIVAENCMKSEMLQPREGEFYFDNADQFVDFGLRNNMFIVGHTLIWHSQLPNWFCADENGNDVSREVLIERMRNHIQTVVGRYKGKVNGWDVVNEAILDDGSFRQSKFYQIIGEDFIRLAFEFAREADPEAELYYNDYSMALEGKRNGTVQMVKSLLEQGVKVDGIGMQGHMGMDFPCYQEFEKSILAFADLGVKVMITELDLSVLPFPRANVGADIANTVEYQHSLNPYTEGLPEEMYAQWHDRYLGFFRLFLKHSDKISRVTLWGLSDSDSWKNDWPVKGRTDYPLLFDRHMEAKPLVNAIIEVAKNTLSEPLMAGIK